MAFDYINDTPYVLKKFRKHDQNTSNAMTIVEIEKIIASPLCVGKRDAAKLLGISERTLTSRSMDGDIPSFVVGGRRLYPVELLQEWIRKKVVEQRKMDGETGNE